MSLVTPERLVPFWNDSGDTIPPYGLFKVDGLENKNGRNVLVAVKPDTFGSQDNVAVNGSVSVSDDGVGACVYDTGPTPLLVTDFIFSSEIEYEDGVYDHVGPVFDSFEAHRGSGGFKVLGVLEEDKIVLAVRSPLLSCKVKVSETVLTNGRDHEATVYDDVSDVYEDLNQLQVRIRLGSAVIDEGTQCEVAFDRGYWYITAAECD